MKQYNPHWMTPEDLQDWWDMSPMFMRDDPVQYERTLEQIFEMALAAANLYQELLDGFKGDAKQ